MILNVTGNREAIFLRCVIELLKYNNGRVLLDIQGHHLAERQFGHITREHPDALERVLKTLMTMFTCYLLNWTRYIPH